ncbi:MAG: hypothetical protein RIA65_08880, partial [Woeseia sp.]
MLKTICRGAAVLSLLSTMAVQSAHGAQELPVLPAGEPTLLTDPYLQNPTDAGVSVVWLTNFSGRSNAVVIELEGRRDKNGNAQEIHYIAETQELDRLLEDNSSKLEMDIPLVSQRVAYRHEAMVDGLDQGKRYTYRIVSKTHEGEVFTAGPFQLQALPKPGTPLKILLTSDQQERFNTLANYQKVAETFPQLDAIFFAGDLANHPRRGSEWLDNYRTSWHENPRSASPSFFPALQGTFTNRVPESPFAGAPLLQNVPLFPSVANHEVSGRFRPNEQYLLGGTLRTANINSIFGDPQPRWYAEHLYEDREDM